MTIHDLAAAYAVDALDPDELAAFTAHLEGCSACRDQVASLREAVALVGATGALSDGASDAAPATLRVAVLAQARRTDQEPAALPVSAPRRGRPRRLVAWVGAAAAAVLVAAFGIGVAAFLHGGPESAALAEHEQAMRIISASDAHTMSVPLGRSSFIMSASYGGAVLMGDTAPMPDPGTEYQLWMTHADGTSEAGPAFMPSHDGTFMVLVDGNMDGVTEIYVTMEPPGGSKTPTGPMVAEAHVGA